MANIAIFNMANNPKNCIAYLESANTGNYVTNPTVTKANRIPNANVLINPSLASVVGVPQKYWKRVVDDIVEMTSGEKAAVDQAAYPPNTPVITTTYTIQMGDTYLLADATSASFVMTLPTAIGISGTIFNVKKIDTTGNSVTISAPGGQTIDGSSSQTLDSEWEALTLQSTGTNYIII